MTIRRKMLLLSIVVFSLLGWQLFKAVNIARIAARRVADQ